MGLVDSHADEVLVGRMSRVRARTTRLRSAAVTTTISIRYYDGYCYRIDLLRRYKLDHVFLLYFRATFSYCLTTNVVSFTFSALFNR